MPEGDVDKVVDALTAAGAGDIGEYARCAFTSPGTGTFTPGTGARPTVGEIGQRNDVPEQRVEMVLPRARRAAVVAALRQAHPYEEPAFDLYELASWSGPRGIGRVGRLAAPTTLREFAMLVAEALPGSAQGVRVWSMQPPGRIRVRLRAANLVRTIPAKSAEPRENVRCERL